MEQNQFNTKETPVDEEPQAVAEKLPTMDDYGYFAPSEKPSSLNAPVVQKDVSDEATVKIDVGEDLKTNTEIGEEIPKKKEGFDDQKSKIEEGEILSENPSTTPENGQIVEHDDVKREAEPDEQPLPDQNPEDAKVRKLFVGGIIFDADEGDLREFYSTFGDIQEIYLARHPVTEQSRGYAFVTFTTKAAVDAVISSRPHQILGKDVTEKRATPKESGMAIDTKSLYIAGISELTTEDGIREYFSKYGEIESIKIHINEATQKPRGFGFINFTDSDAVDQCVLDKLYHVIAGVEIKASKAIPRDLQKNRDRANRFNRSRGCNRNPQQTNYFGHGNNNHAAAGFDAWGYSQPAAPGWMVPPKGFGAWGQTAPGYPQPRVNQNLAYRMAAGAETSSSGAPPYMKAYFEAMATNTRYPPYFPPPRPPGSNDF